MNARPDRGECFPSFQKGSVSPAKARSLEELLTHKQTQGDREGGLAGALALRRRQDRSFGSLWTIGVPCSSADGYRDPS